MFEQDWERHGRQRLKAGMSLCHYRVRRWKLCAGQVSVQKWQMAFFGASASLVRRRASKVKKFGDGRRPAKSALPRNDCAGNTYTSATEESTGQKRCEKIQLLPSADATSQDSFLNPSDRSPWPEYLLRLIGMELEVPRCQYIAAEQGASAAFSVLLPKWKNRDRNV